MFTSSAKMFLVVSLFAASSVMADVSYTCTHGKETRTLSVSMTDGKAPCEVKYTKGSDTKMLWSAKKQADYCETKVTEFTGKLKAQGWSCAENAAQPADTEAPAAGKPAEAPAAQ